MVYLEVLLGHSLGGAASAAGLVVLQGYLSHKK